MTPDSLSDHTLLDDFKREAAAAALEHVQSDSVIGLGTGSTSAHFLKLLGERIQDGTLSNIAGVPTSEGAAAQAKKYGIPLTSFEHHLELVLTVDGADEVDPWLNMIKGGGGALLREKIVAQASRTLIIIVDESKLSSRLGVNWPVPIEVIPFGWQTQRAYLENLGAQVDVRLAESGKPLLTDQGNLILDCRFGPIDDPYVLASKLDARPGIVEHGLFLGMADELIVAGHDGIRTVHRKH